MIRADLFCTVIDNFGDIGVCWRLAQQLQHEHGWQVRLWVDEWASFAILEPRLTPTRDQQTVNGIDIRRWHTPHFPTNIIPHDVVIEGFACRLPDTFLQAMANRLSPPVWLNLEYLSAEQWPLDCHGLPSRHPTLPLQQFFYFPSFDPRGGGLLREHDLLSQRDEFQQHPALQQQFWQQLGQPQALHADYRLSLFAYEQAAVPALLTALSQQAQTVFIAIPTGRVLTSVQHWTHTPLAIGDTYTRGNVTLAVIPFLTPSLYDQLLWACDLNFVRGEDSFIRAHWAGKPLLWHIYPQTDNAHFDKLEAWLAVSQPFIDEDWQTLQRGWVAEHTDITLWTTLLSQLTTAHRQHRAFSKHLNQQPDLCQKLVTFCTQHAAI